MNIFLEHMDYPFLSCGVVFFLFALVCFLLFYHERHRGLWKWLGIFGCLQGGHELIHLVEPLLKEPGLLALICSLVWGASLLVFLEIMALPLGKGLRRSFRGRHMIFAACLLAAGAMTGGRAGVGILFSYVIAFCAMGWLIWRVPLIVKDHEKREDRIFLWASMVLVGVYTLTLTVISVADGEAGYVLNDGDFRKIFGYSIHVVRSALIFAAAVVLWFYHHRVLRSRFTQKSRVLILRGQRIFLVCLAVVFLAGWIFVSWAGEKARIRQEHDLLGMARIVTAGVNPATAAVIKGAREDRQTAAYMRLREQQIAFARAALLWGDVRWFYQMVMRDGRIVFTVDSIPLDDKDHSEPGDIYADAPPGLYDIFRDGKAGLVGPYTDQWGTFISAFVPILDPGTGAVLGVQGIDVDNRVFLMTVVEQKIAAVLIVMLVVILISGLFLWQVRARETADALKIAFDGLRQANVLRSEAEVQMIDFVEAMPSPVYFKDENFVYQKCNQAFADYIGLPKKKIIGATIHDVAPRELAERYHAADLEAMTRGGRQEYEGRMSNVNGTDRDVIFYKSVLRHADGRARGIIGVVLDITGRKKMERDLRENQERVVAALEELEKINTELKRAQQQLVQSEKLAAVGTLAAGVAHEINNPLGFVQSNVSVLREYMHVFLDILAEYDKLTAALEARNTEGAKALQASIKTLEHGSKFALFRKDVPSLLEESENGLDRIKRIVAGLQNFAAAERGVMARVDMNALLDGIFNIVGNDARGRVEFVKEYGKDLFVEADEQRLGQVFINLIVNAVQAIENKGTVRLRTYRQEGQVVVEVADTGCGIPEQDIPKLFVPFFTTKGPGKGTGLGLPISYDIIKKHNGAILVESQVGKGTTFRVVLPAFKAA